MSGRSSGGEGERATPTTAATGGNGQASGSRARISNRATGQGGPSPGNGFTGIAAARSGPPDDGEPMIGVSPFVSIPTLVAALRQRWQAWVLLAVLGLLGGFFFAVLSPSPYSATATILLQHPSGTDAERAMPTELQLLKTRVVAQGAIDRARLHLSAKSLLTHYDGAILSDRVLTVTARGTSASEAVRRGDALAASYLSFRQSQFQQQLRAGVQAIQERETALTGELSSLNAQIGAYGASTQKDPAAVRAFGDVLTHRAQVDDQIATLRRQVDADTSDTGAVAAGSRVVDPAAEGNRSPLKTAVRDALAGLVFGLVAGVGGTVTREVTSEAVHSRADVSAALGAPVAVSVGPVHKPLWGGLRSLHPDAVAEAPGVPPVVRHLHHVLDHAGGARRALLVVPVGVDWPAALAVAALGHELDQEGANVLVADWSKGGELRRQPEAARHWTLVQAPARGGAGPDEAEASGDPDRDDDVLLVLAALDPGLGAFQLQAWATTAVAVVTAGRATPTALHSVGQMLRAAGIDLVSAVLVGANRSDETLGVPHGPGPGPVPAPPPGAPTRSGDTPAEAPAPSSGPGPKG